MMCDGVCTDRVVTLSENAAGMIEALLICYK